MVKQMKPKTETMKKYEVRITFQPEYVDVEAKNEDDAIEKAEAKWYDDSAYPETEDVEVWSESDLEDGE